jgi:hypothetical protein
MAAGASVNAACDSAHATLAGCDPDLGLVCIPTVPDGGVADGGTEPTIGTCQSVILAAAGAACGDVGMPITSATECNAGGLCVKKVCVAPVKVGVACDAVAGPPCLSPAVCVNAVCTEPDATKCQ